MLIVLGGNDFVNNYFQPLSLRPRQYSLPDFARLVVTEYRKILKVYYFFNLTGHMSFILSMRLGFKNLWPVIAEAV